jgi:hypothetical protein
MVPVIAHHELLEHEGACLNASRLRIAATSRAFLAPPPRPSPKKRAAPSVSFAVLTRVDSAASGRGSLTQKRSAGPARTGPRGEPSPAALAARAFWPTETSHSASSLPLRKPISPASLAIFSASMRRIDDCTPGASRWPFEPQIGYLARRQRRPAARRSVVGRAAPDGPSARGELVEHPRRRRPERRPRRQPPPAGLPGYAAPPPADRWCSNYLQRSATSPVAHRKDGSRPNATSLSHQARVFVGLARSRFAPPLAPSQG